VIAEHIQTQIQHVEIIILFTAGCMVPPKDDSYFKFTDISPSFNFQKPDIK